MSEASKRLMAVVVAAALVAGAWWIRSNWIVDNTDASRQNVAAGDALRLACDPAVVVCQKLRDGDAATMSNVDVVVEAPGTTARRFADDNNPPDLWITADMWVLIAQAAESPEVDVDLLSTPFGEISLFGLGEPPKVTRLGELCPDLTVSCLGELTGTRWGEPNVAQVADRFDLGIDPPGTTGALLTVADATVGWSGVDRPDINAFNDVRARVDSMLRNSVPVRSGSTAQREFGSTQAAFDLVTTTDGTTRLAAGAVEPFPLGGLTSAVVLAGRAGIDAGDGVDAISRAAESLGVDISPSPSAELTVDSLPNGATLEAMWNEAIQEYPS